MNTRYSPTENTCYPYEIDYKAVPKDCIDMSIDDATKLMISAHAKAIESKANDPAQLLANLSAAVQRHLDTTEQAYRYDGILSAVSYADDGTAFGKQGATFKSWRSDVWLAAAEIEVEVKDGKRDIPTEKELIELLPKFEELKS